VIDNANEIVRPYSLSAFVPSPKRVFLLGLATGSWAQVIANNPQVESVGLPAKLDVQRLRV
jgi:spermidine synthase